MAPKPHFPFFTSPSAAAVLLLLQIATPQRPCGLLLHDAQSYAAEYGHLPAQRPDYVALTGLGGLLGGAGTRGAARRGAGLPPALARSLLARQGWWRVI